MDELLQAIIEAATWIDRVNPRIEDNFYRSEELRPGFLIANGRYQKDALVRVVQQRRAYLQSAAIDLLTLEEVAEKGKLLLIDPLDSELDGGAEAYSQGYFDLWDCAPWDTWVAFGSETLKSAADSAVMSPFLARLRHFQATSFDALIAWVPTAQLNWVYSGREVSLREQNIEWWSGTDAYAPDDSALNRLFAPPTGLLFEEIAYDEFIGQRLEIINRSKAIARH